MERGEKLDYILKKLGSDQFSGVCSLAYQDRTIEIVLEKGRIFLASVDALSGDDAMQVITGLWDQPVDAAISDLTPAQLQLSREFNEDCIVHHPSTLGKGIPPSPHERRRTGPELESLPTTPPEPSGPAAFHPSSPEDPLAREGGPVHPGEPRMEPVLSKGTGTLVANPEDMESPDDQDIPSMGSGYILIDKDLAALDSMDLDTMTSKIRENCKSMVERLQLGYLVVDTDKKESE